MELYHLITHIMITDGHYFILSNKYTMYNEPTNNIKMHEQRVMHTRDNRGLSCSQRE